jgi:alpha-galactosidase
MYKFNPGYGDGSYNVMELDGKEFYRRNPGEDPIHAEVKLEGGKRYPVRIIYFKRAHKAFWVIRQDLPGTLSKLTKYDKKFPHLVDDKGNWTTRNDVYYYEARIKFQGGPLTVPIPGSGTIGPELQFGHVMGHYHDEQVLVIKTAMGNRALAWDFRPPSSGKLPDIREDLKKWEGLEYRLMVEGVRKTLDNIATIVPNYKGQGYEITGFGWFQGHKDGGNQAWTDEYESNLVNLIKDVRAEFKVPKLPVVIATVGFNGRDMKGRYLQILEAQTAVSGEKGNYPEFAGNVLTVDTRDFWRSVEESPSKQGYHYNRNAETYVLVGDALGRGMVKLLMKPKKQAFSKSQTELQEDFLKLKFGMFIHFNLATYKGVQWVSGYHDPSTFNPGSKIDTDAWADAAVSAGMKYGVLTAKHVSGFCLWDSKYTTYDVMHPDCPYQEDLVAQFIKSFKSRGLKVGLYYCWRHPGFKEKFKVLPPECDPATHTLDEQNKFQKAQIAELLTKYPDVFYIWNDALDPKVMTACEITDHIRSIRPDTITSANWWDWSKKGKPYLDLGVTEMGHFPKGNKTLGETCWCLEQKWFWNKGFHSQKAKDIVSHIIKANSRNANFLLNVGPDKNGNIVDSSIKTLANIGKLWEPNATPPSPNVDTGTDGSPEKDGNPVQ